MTSDRRLLLALVAAFGLLTAAVPERHRRAWAALSKRTRDTLIALYVLRAATALVTFVTALVTAYDLVVGNVARPVAVGPVGWVFVARLPDVFVRLRLAERTAHFPGRLCFVGFTGGIHPGAGRHHRRARRRRPAVRGGDAAGG